MELPKSYNPKYVREKNLCWYNTNVRDVPEEYAKKKKQVASYMKNRYANDPEYREKQKQRQKDLYERKKSLKKN